VWSTVPHYAAVCFFICPGILERVYAVIIVTSASFSVLWHILEEPQNWVKYLDYAFASVWVAADLYLAGRACPLVLMFVLLFNILVGGTNKIVDALAQMKFGDYATLHGYWHLFSAAKSICTAFLLGCHWNENTCP
jgi:hypothetical protein